MRRAILTRWVKLLVILFFLVACSQNVTMEGVDESVASDIQQKVNELIGEMPVDFGPHDAEIYWSEEKWERIH